MNEKNFTPLVRRISTLLLLFLFLTQILTVILMEFTAIGHEAEEIHELTGFIMIGLVLVHAIIFRRSLLSMIRVKS